MSNADVPSAGPPPASPSAPPPPISTSPSTEHGMILSELPAPSPGYDASPPQNLTLQPSASSPTPRSPQPIASCAPTAQFWGAASFSGAHNFVIKDSQFNDFHPEGSGLKELLKYSMPDAFHNSAARYPPPKCHLGTRIDYIARITDWALGSSDHKEPILWLCGPFGIGKSAVAQSCAEALQRRNQLAATLFFSRSNADRDDPRRVFTSIAYQIAMLCKPFNSIVDARAREDPAFATKSLSTQFEELLIQPLSQIDDVGSGIEGRVVIIDGLDECRGSLEQCEIIRVIAASAHDRTTPFRWFITSRPEVPIIRTMKSPTVLPVSFHLDLPVSRKIDHEILLYLVDEFKKICESRDLDESWASEEVLALLVDRTAGLWIYATTIIRFITDENSLGPQDQLRIVLEFAKDMSGRGEPDNPLAEMDFFYTLIIQQIPQKIRTVVRKILLLHSVAFLGPKFIASVLGLSEEQFRHSCASIQSVVKLGGPHLISAAIHFYHASFLDFMRDPARSKELCIYSDFLIETRRESFDWLHQVCSQNTGFSDIIFPSKRVLLDGWNDGWHYIGNLRSFWHLCCVPNHSFDIQTAVSFEKLQFHKMLRLMHNHQYSMPPDALQHFRNNLPSEFRDKIVREDRCPTLGCTNTNSVWVLGHGENETVTKWDKKGSLWLVNNQSLPYIQCFCGSKLKTERKP